MDPSSAAVPGASVMVVHSATNVSIPTQTNGEGNFVAVLDPGVYTVTVEAAGFKKSVVSGITVRTGDHLGMDFRLEIGALGESVTVKGEAPLLETANADLAQVVERRYIDQLYIPNRNPLNLLALTPGVTGIDDGRFSDSQQNQFSINGGGGQEGNNEIIIDGASVVMPRQRGSIAASPSGDAVQEFRVQTTLFDSSYGRTAGGVVSYSTRSGGNQLHGSFEGFLRKNVLEANGWTRNRNGLPRPDIDRKFFSGALGGPLYLPKLYDGRNRTFFFFNVQKENITTGSTFLGRVFTDLERKGDFSQTLSPQGTPLAVYDPFTTVVSGSTAMRQPFSGVRIPASRFDATGAALANAYPLPNQQGTPQVGVQNWGGVGSNSEPAKQVSLRMDQVVSARQRFYGRFGFMTFDQNLTGVPDGFEFAGEDHRHFFTGNLNDDYTINPTFLMTLRYSFGRYSSDTFYSAQRMDPAALKVADIVVRNAIFFSWPRFIPAEGLIGTGGRIKYRANDTHSIVPTFTKLAGNHSVRFGADLRLVNWNSREPGFDGAGRFDFNNTFTRSDPFAPATARLSGTSMASILLGTPSGGNLGGSTPYSLRHYYYAGFVQDDWKVTRKLTLNLGLRYEIETPYRERYDRLTYGFDYTSPNPVQVPGMQLRGGLLFAGASGQPRWQGQFDKNNFGPRFGLAYQLRSTTVLRMGYGLFYGSDSGELDTTTGVPPTYNVAAPYVASTDAGATPFTTLANPYPNGVPPITGNSLGLASRIGNSISFTDQNRVSLYSQQWQFSIQQSLPSKIRVEAAFVRMLSLKGMESFNLNEKPDQYLALGADENRRVPNPFFGIFPADSSLGGASTVVQRQFWLAYPQFSGVSKQGSNTRKTVYHAVQINMEKRLSHGLTVLGNFTGSKLLQNYTSSLVNTRRYRTVSELDIPRVFNVAYVYELPFGKASKGVTRRLLGGWSTSGRLNLSAGTPLQITDSNGRPVRLRNAAKSGPVSERLGDRFDPATRQVLNPYFDVTAFQSLPNQYVISPTPPFLPELRTPGRRSFDMSLIKHIGVRENVGVDVRADASNLTNTPNFDAPDTNMANRANFGVIRSAGAGRIVQFAFRVIF
ncbi:MAG: TonB-dependent receptor [Acidobacteria bacterium]|nr:TonB-dependent receptor [Acidobacteriota bacterium]